MMKFLLILKVELGFFGVELDFGCLLFLVFDDFIFKGVGFVGVELGFGCLLFLVFGDFIFKSVCFVGVELGFIGIGFVGVFLLMEIL